MNSELLKQIDMAPRVSLGSYITRVERANSSQEYGADDVRGVSNTKGFMNTRANIEGRSLKNFLVVQPQEFVFNRRTTRNGERLGLGFNMTERAFILTEDYVAFRVKPEKEEVLLPCFLYLYFLRDEFDRYVRSNSWGSATEFFNWDHMCRVNIPLPPIEVQRAYVENYKGLTALIEQNEAWLKSLEAATQAYVPKSRLKWPMVKIGDYIQSFTRRNSEDRELPFMGVNRDKQIVPTVANTGNIERTKYSVLKQGELVFSGMQTGRDVCIRIALWENDTDILLSPAYTTFRLDASKPLLPQYFFLNFKSIEMDRQGWFKSDSSVRSNLDWERFCEIQIPLPPIEIQKAYVEAYTGLTALIEENEALLKSLEAAAQACVAECREKWPFVELCAYIRRIDRRNADNAIKAVKGLSVSKLFREPTSKVDKTKLQNYKIVLQNQFSFVQTTNNEKCLVTCLSTFDYPIVVSSVNEVFEIVDTEKLLPQFLYLQFKRPEFDRYARFNSWGSARETFTWDDMCRVKIPLPPIEVQKAIVALYHCAEEARSIADEARAQLAQACPAMIQQAAHRR